MTNPDRKSQDVDSNHPDPRPRAFHLRERWWEIFNPDRAATLRWRARNAEQPVECACGSPAVTQIFSPYPVRGSVQPFWPRCEEHADVPLTTPWSNGLPLINQTREACSWSTSRIGGPITDCGCKTHIGQMRP